MSWRYRGDPGSGAPAEVGTHLIDVAEYLCGPIASVTGATLRTVVAERPIPLRAAVGHAAVEISDEMGPVQNEDIGTFIATLAEGAVGTFAVSRVAFGLPNSPRFELFGETGAASFDLARLAEFPFCDGAPAPSTQGYRSVLVGPARPYVEGGLPMAFPGAGHGNIEFFTYQARAFLEQVAGLNGLPPCASSAEALHDARHQGRRGIPVLRWQECTAARDHISAPRCRGPGGKGSAVKLGVYTACLHDKPLAESLRLIKELGLESAEINSGVFLPAPHLAPGIRSSNVARNDLGTFASAGVSLTALNCNGNPLDPDPTVGQKHAQDLRDSISLAAELGVKRVV